MSQSEAEENSRKFVIDSGCTSHILTTKEYFTEFFEPEEEFFISNVDLSRHKVIAYRPDEIPLQDKNGHYFQLQLKEAISVHISLQSTFSGLLDKSWEESCFDQKINSIPCGNTFLEPLKALFPFPPHTLFKENKLNIKDYI